MEEGGVHGGSDEQVVLSPLDGSSEEGLSQVARDVGLTVGVPAHEHGALALGLLDDVREAEEVDGPRLGLLV